MNNQQKQNTNINNGSLIRTPAQIMSGEALPVIASSTSVFDVSYNEINTLEI